MNNPLAIMGIPLYVYLNIYSFSDLVTLRDTISRNKEYFPFFIYPGAESYFFEHTALDFSIGFEEEERELTIEIPCTIIFNVNAKKLEDTVLGVSKISGSRDLSGYFSLYEYMSAIQNKKDNKQVD